MNRLSRLEALIMMLPRIFSGQEPFRTMAFSLAMYSQTGYGRFSSVFDSAMKISDPSGEYIATAISSLWRLATIRIA